MSVNQSSAKRSQQTSKGSKQSFNGGHFTANVSDFKCNPNSPGGSGPVKNIFTFFKGCKISVIPEVKDDNLNINIKITKGKKEFKYIVYYPVGEAIDEYMTNEPAQSEQPQEEKESGEDSKESH